MNLLLIQLNLTCTVVQMLLDHPVQQPATSWQQAGMSNNVDGMRLYGPRGGYISNIDMGGFSWGGGQPQQQQQGHARCSDVKLEQLFYHYW